MSKIKSFGSEIEMTVKSHLSVLGVLAVYQPKMRGKPDFFLPGCNVALFVDSCFWHSCPEHYRTPKSNVDFWEVKMSGNAKRDELVKTELTQMGFNVVRLWGCVVKKLSPLELLNIIQKEKGKNIDSLPKRIP